MSSTESHSAPEGQSDPFASEPGPELVFGIIGPLGIDQDQLTKILQQELQRVGYQSAVIRLSALISQIRGLDTRPTSAPEHERIRSHMHAGTELRTRTRIGGILARLAIAAIQQERERLTGSATRPNRRQAYLLRSFKHRDELRDLRDVYGDGLVTISAYAPKQVRERALTAALARSTPGADRSNLRTTAADLIETDEREEGHELGQNVEGAFPLADLFVEASDQKRLRESLRRFIEIFFGNHFITPTRDEFGMYQATAAAYRSSDLSRQVGAALVSRDGDIVAVGCNDTPKAGGGLYWIGDRPAGRDFELFGHDPSEQAKREIVAETLERLRQAKFLSRRAERRNTSEAADELLSGPLKGAQIGNLLEFGRVLHAEMATITDAARRGVATKGATLHCTTFPCHLCARLIISAGIERVTFIEPYPKSKTLELYYDSVVVDKLDLVRDKVNFQAFVGIAPRKYQLFRLESGRKKSGGAAVHWEPSEARPRIRRFQTSYIAMETSVAVSIPNLLQPAGLSWDK